MAKSQAGPAGKDECVQAESQLRILQALNYHTLQFTSFTSKLKHILTTSFAHVRGFLMFCSCCFIIVILQWMQSQKLFSFITNSTVSFANREQ